MPRNLPVLLDATGVAAPVLHLATSGCGSHLCCCGPPYGRASLSPHVPKSNRGGRERTTDGETQYGRTAHLTRTICCTQESPPGATSSVGDSVKARTNPRHRRQAGFTFAPADPVRACRGLDYDVGLSPIATERGMSQATPQTPRSAACLCPNRMGAFSAVGRAPYVFLRISLQ